MGRASWHRRNGHEGVRAHSDGILPKGGVMETTLNMDQLAAEFSQQIVETLRKQMVIDKLTNLVTKTLGVLQEQGIYAMMLFLFSRTSDESKITPVIRKELIEMLKLCNWDDAILLFSLTMAVT